MIERMTGFLGRAEVRHLRLSYSRTGLEHIDEGIRRLGGLLTDTIEEAR